MQVHQETLVLFDIQPNQNKEVVKLVHAYKLPVMSQVPIITVRVEEINGKKPKLTRGAFNGELRVTFQDSLTKSEKIVAGTWTGLAKPDKPVYISLESAYAKRIEVNVSDKITFNVQGMLIPTIIGSLREVNWTSMQTRIYNTVYGCF